jgi:hypothetical protein
MDCRLGADGWRLREQCDHVLCRVKRNVFLPDSGTECLGGPPIGLLLGTAFCFSGFVAIMIVLMTWLTSALTSTYLAGTSGACTCSLKPPLSPLDAGVAMELARVSDAFCFMGRPFSSNPCAFSSSTIALRKRLRAHERTQLDFVRSVPVVTCHQSPSCFRSLCRLLCASCNGCH